MKRKVIKTKAVRTATSTNKQGGLKKPGGVLSNRPNAPRMNTGGGRPCGRCLTT
jgi:hypothetical protein